MTQKTLPLDNIIAYTHRDVSVQLGQKKEATTVLAAIGELSNVMSQHAVKATQLSEKYHRITEELISVTPYLTNWDTALWETQPETWEKLSTATKHLLIDMYDGANPDD